MPQMRIAPGAVDFRAAHEPTAIFLFPDSFFIDRCIETWPSRAAVEFCALLEQRGTATHATECAIVLWEVVVGEGTLGRMFAGDAIGRILKLCAPFRVSFDQFFHLTHGSVSVSYRRHI